MPGFENGFPLISAPGLFAQFLRAAGFFDGSGREAGPPLTDEERFNQAMDQASRRVGEDSEGIDTAILEALYDQGWSNEPVEFLPGPGTGDKPPPVPISVSDTPAPLLTTGSAHDNSPVPVIEPRHGTSTTGPESGQNQNQQSSSNFPVGPVLGALGGLAVGSQLGGDSIDTQIPVPGIQQVPPASATATPLPPVVESTPAWVNPNPENASPDPNSEKPWWYGILKDLTAGIIPGLGNELTLKILEEIGGSPGERLRDFNRDAFPGTNAWEQLGASSNSAATGLPQQLLMQQKELDNRLKIAQIQAQASVDTATISSKAHIEGAGISSQPGHRQAGVAESMVRHQQSELESRVFLQQAQADLARNQSYNTEVRTLLEKSALMIADDLNNAKLQKEKVGTFWTMINSLATGNTDVAFINSVNQFMGDLPFEMQKNYNWIIDQIKTATDATIRNFPMEHLQLPGERPSNVNPRRNQSRGNQRR